MHRLRTIDWEAIAGVAAAVTALVLHLLHIVEQDVLLSVTLVLLAVLLIRDLRREDREEGKDAAWTATQADLRRISAAMTPADVLLIGPRQLRAESEQFALRARGEMVWFNVCLLMFEPQVLFDTLLRPAVENPAVTSIRFILDPRERQRWESAVMPKLAKCAGHAKVVEPRWSTLDEASSFILAETDGGAEAHLSFWGEPFMSRTTGGDIPRYVFHVQPHSQLIERLDEMARQYRLPVHDET